MINERRNMKKHFLFIVFILGMASCTNVPLSIPTSTPMPTKASMPTITRVLVTPTHTEEPSNLDLMLTECKNSVDTKMAKSALIYMYIGNTINELINRGDISDCYSKRISLYATVDIAILDHISSQELYNSTFAAH